MKNELKGLIIEKLSEIDNEKFLKRIYISLREYVKEKGVENE